MDDVQKRGKLIVGPIRRILIEACCLGDADGQFEDVEPAVAELRRMGVEVLTSGESVENPEGTLYITDSREGILSARERGLIPVLLMHNPDEAMKLTKLDPAGGIVSLLELPDFVRFVGIHS